MGRFWRFLGVLGRGRLWCRGKIPEGGKGAPSGRICGERMGLLSLSSVSVRTKNRGFFGVLGRFEAGLGAE